MNDDDQKIVDRINKKLLLSVEEADIRNTVYYSSTELEEAVDSFNFDASIGGKLFKNYKLGLILSKIPKNTL